MELLTSMTLSSSLTTSGKVGRCLGRRDQHASIKHFMDPGTVRS